VSARRADDVEAWADGWCPARDASEALVWRPVTREARGLRTWVRDTSAREWVADELLPRGARPWAHRHGRLDTAQRRHPVFELPAKGPDVPALDAPDPQRWAFDPAAVRAALGPVEGEDAPPADDGRGEELGAEQPAAALDGDAAPLDAHQLGAVDPSAEYSNDAPALDASRGAPDDAPAVEAPREPFVPWQSAPFPTLTSSRPSRPGRSSAPRAPLPDDAAAVRAALADPEAVAAALGLCDGPQGWGRGAGWTRVAGGVLVQCPVHGDHTPSCSITRGPDGTLRVRCFGCDLAGDALHLVAAVYSLDARANFVRVLEHAAHLAGVRLSTPGERAPVAPPPRRAPPPASLQPLAPAGLAPDVFAALVRALLAAAPLDGPHGADVRAYLDARGILAAARADGWGALPASEAARGDVRARVVAAVGVEAWEASGLAHPHDSARWCWGSSHRVVIPWRSAEGEPVWLQRRAVGRVDGARYVAPGGTSPAAPYGAHQLAALALDAPVALVEGAVDALALRAACEVDGSPVAVLGLPGVKGWRRPWGALLAGRPVALALDGDAAGDAAAEHMARELAGIASKVERWKPQDGAKDWGEAWERTKATARAS